jgi:hypothetical protein
MELLRDRKKTTILIDRQTYAWLKACLEINEITLSDWVEEKARAYINASMPAVPRIRQSD